MRLLRGAASECRGSQRAGGWLEEITSDRVGSYHTGSRGAAVGQTGYDEYAADVEARLVLKMWRFLLSNCATGRFLQGAGLFYLATFAAQLCCGSNRRHKVKLIAQAIE